MILISKKMDKAGKLEEIIKRKIKTHEPLDGHTVLQIPSFAEFYLETEAQDILIKAVNGGRSLGLPVYLLGSGSRIETEKEIKGLVIKNLCRRFDKASVKGTIKKNEIGVEHVQVYAQAGVLMNQLVRFTIEEGLSGLEYQLGLPGTVGGAVFTSAKYKPKYLPVNKVLQSVTLLSEEGDMQTYNGEVPYFVYTDDLWHETKDVILSVIFKLTPMDKKILWERAEEAVRYRNQEAGNKNQGNV
jgi:UDP-N-acetylmuramate dehydrogenase